MKYLAIPFSSFLFCINIGIQSHDLPSVIGFGDSLFISGNYIVALQEYRRAYFFAGDELKLPLSLKIAECCLALEDFEIARNFYDSAARYSEHNDIRIECEFQKIYTFMMEGNFGYALFILNHFEAGNETRLQKRKSLYQGLCCFGTGQFEESHMHFLNTLSQTDTLKIARLQELYGDIKKLKRPVPGLAMALSIIVPGAGQVYAGDVKDGLNSLFLLGGLVYIGISGLFINPLVTVPFVQRYYLGGIINAQRTAREKRTKKQYDYLAEYGWVLSDTSSLTTFFDPGVKANRYTADPANLESELKLIVYLCYLGYKEFISSQDVDACVFYPSCSTYAMEAINKIGVITGTLDGLDRLLRCHHFVGKREYPFDPIINKFYDPL